MLFEHFDLRGLPLKNRMVMAPMTRNRATAAHVPTPLMRVYYEQRASFGLIVTEGTSPSADGLGYARIPGLFSAEQVAAWRLVTDAVHAEGGRIFAQLMHCGRASHVLNLPAGARVVGPTSTPLAETIFTDESGPQLASPPHALTETEIALVVAEYAHAARCAMDAGFDGVELHAANGYLIEQFLNANVNTRSDRYGGSIDGRNRFALEVVRAVRTAIGATRTGIRISPYGTFNATGAFPEVEAQFLALVTSLGALGIVYLHLVDHSSMGAPTIPASFKLALRRAFRGVFIGSGGLDHTTGEAMLTSRAADLVAFGRAALANPDLPARFEHDLPLNAPDAATFYTPGEQGYTDYPCADMPVATLGG
ncbi:MAG: alkene reductase [Gemmatimonadetes bacterium]|nr:alkene reductase [Gemmatimonadota bacterium]